MEAGPLWAATAAELAARFAAGEATPEQALEAVLARIEAVNGRLNAVVTLDLAGAREAAAAATRRWRDGQALGALDGVPLTVKDNLFVGGLRATWGSRLFAGHAAPRDDLPVRRLRESGAVILGKTNTPELALAGHTDNLLFGSTGNPWNPDLSPGGSSGGAVAAVASGCGPIAIATDAGGSIRRPSGHAGVTGLKPGIGRVPRRYGFPPLAHDLQVVGAIARCVRDLRAAFGLMATPETRPTAPGPLRIAFFGRIGDAPVEAAVGRAFEFGCAVLRTLGHALEEIAPPWDVEEVNRLFGALASTGVARVVSGFPGWQDLVTPAIAQQAAAGMARTGVEYARDLEAVTAFRWHMADLFTRFDVIATPAAAALAWPRTDAYPAVIGGQDAGPRGSAIFSTAVNLAGLPAIVVPGRVAPGGLPAGLQFIGGMGAEERLLDLAEGFEAASPWPQIAPGLG